LRWIEHFHQKKYATFTSFIKGFAKKPQRLIAHFPPENIQQILPAPYWFSPKKLCQLLKATAMERDSRRKKKMPFNRI